MDGFDIERQQLLNEIQRLNSENLILKNMHNYVQTTLDKRTENIAELSVIIQRAVQQRIHMEDEILRHRNILISVAEIAQNFLMARGWQELVEIALALLERAACVSRVYLFKNHSGANGELLSSQLFEKCATGITPQINNENCQNLNWLESGLQDWYKLLSKGEVVVRKHSEYSQEESEILETQQINSILIVPLFIKGNFWGIMGFDDCLVERDWSDSEIAALKSAVVVIAAAIEREQSEIMLREHEKIRLEDAEKKRDDLVREVHHRIKNHLQGLSGLLRQRKNKKYDFHLIIDEALTQIDSIAVVYGLQSTHPDGQIYFGQMISAIISSIENLSTLSIDVTRGVGIGSCEVDRSKAVALALVVNEVIMNAIKHSQSEDETAVIKVHHEHGDQQIILSITNPGMLPQGFDFQADSGLGIGLELAKSMLPGKGAKLTLENVDKVVVTQLIISEPLLISV